jgi:hypothetical protein
MVWIASEKWDFLAGVSNCFAFKSPYPWLLPKPVGIPEEDPTDSHALSELPTFHYIKQLKLDIKKSNGMATSILDLKCRLLQSCSSRDHRQIWNLESVGVVSNAMICTNHINLFINTSSSLAYVVGNTSMANRGNKPRLCGHHPISLWCAKIRFRPV